ncbi:Rne/Rng family ribonuclease [Halarsenatibacter silvermanii]|uniref:Ribonuclease G n=1 Tax=Halarsenatibacter silvermanii TaxID=321763 RepID=A0A1G9PBW3_9FIRM|nr:Rne/Rng family ribonuclease [Halarsenatibacter silvermanii]SDL96248.1 ribonuclease G [Halarsenatibacter silvermanii]
MSRNDKKIIINSGIREKRAAVLVNDNLDNIFFERDTYDRDAGSIYRGKVKDVLPGMQAAFVDIGNDRNAFLHLNDAYPLFNSKQRHLYSQKNLKINQVLSPGQEIMIQVTKEPIKSKGAKITCRVSLPGRYYVFLPHDTRTNISRRIDDQQERNRLKSITGEIVDDSHGVIIRTNAAGKHKKLLLKDYNFLKSLWERIKNRYYRSSAPKLLHSDINLIHQVVRDHLSSDIDRVVIDDQEDYENLSSFAEKLAPNINSRIFLYERDRPIFETYGIEQELKSLMQRKVWLKSGGYITFDSTEALVAVDVNTGKFTGQKNLQDTVFKTNLEAAKEISRQLRLRDIGGIIIIDFIDMEIKSNREKVLEVLEREMENDRTKTSILGLTELGLVEMTRKKVRERLGELIQKECPYCEGTGRIISETTMAFRVIRKLTSLASRENFQAILLEVHPDVASVLIGNRGEKLNILEEELNKDIYIRGNNDLHMKDINIIDKGSRKRLKEMALPVKEGGKYRFKIEEQHSENESAGIARKKGYIIIIEEAGDKVGEKVKVKITSVNRTYAQAELIA